MSRTEICPGVGHEAHNGDETADLLSGCPAPGDEPL